MIFLKSYFSGGLQPGDVIISINDSIVKDSAEVYKALEVSEELRLIVLRKQQKLVLTIIPQDVDWYKFCTVFFISYLKLFMKQAIY